MMKYVHPLFAPVLLSCLVLLVGASSQEKKPYLIKIPRADSTVVMVLRDRAIPVYGKVEGWYFGGADRKDLRELSAAGIEYDVVDEEAWSEPYSLIYRCWKGERDLLPRAGRVVFQDDHTMLVKIADEDVLEIIQAGFHPTRLYPHPLPVTDERKEGIVPPVLDRGPEEVIEALVHRISEDSLRSYIQRLQDFQTRYIGTDSNEAAAQWITDKFYEFGYELVETPRSHVYGTLVDVNSVIAVKLGILYQDSVFIIGAHFDSVVRDGTDPHTWAPGADDNATGVAAVLEAARIVADIDFDYTVKFACWNDEEVSLSGSGWYAGSAYFDGQKIGLYINLDMIGFLDEKIPLRDINILRNPSAQAQACAEFMAEMADRYATLVPVHIETEWGGSDHSYFMWHGYDILWVWESNFDDYKTNPHYHTATDVIDHVDMSYVYDVAKMSLASFFALAGPPESLPQPSIVLENYHMDDTGKNGSAGNGNGYIDPGETIQLSVSVLNDGDAQARDVHGRLFTGDPSVILIDGETPFGDIPPRGSSMGRSPFRFAISEDCPNGRYVTFSLEASAAGGYEWTTSFTVRVTQPDIFYKTFTFEEVVGDDDGVPDPGEILNLYLFLGNDGLRDASGITAELDTDDPDVSITDSRAVFPDMALDAAIENSDPFTFFVSGDADYRAIVFAVHLSEGEGYYERDLTFRLLMGQGIVLFFPDDGETGNEEYYIDAFQTLGVPYEIGEILGTAKSAPNELLDYSEVIWFTGSEESNTLTSDDQSDLEAFLCNGGRLLLSGNMIGYDIGDSPFYRDYLHGHYISFMTMLHHLNGTPSNPVVDGMDITLSSEGSNAQGFAGETDPISPAVSIFDYDRNTEEGPGTVASSGSGAVAVENSVSKVVYFSFGVEGIEPLEDRLRVLLDVLAWFKEPGIDKGDVDGNGTTDIIDAVMAVNIVLGMHQPDEGETARADMNYDGSLDIIDVVKIVNAVLGIGGKATVGDVTDM